MPTIEAVIKNNIHYISCNEGEEKSLNQLVQKFRAKVDELSLVLPNADDKTLYLIAGLMFLDHLEEQTPGNTITTNSDEKQSEHIITQAANMDKLTETVENLIEKLSKSSVI